MDYKNPTNIKLSRNTPVKTSFGVCVFLKQWIKTVIYHVYKEHLFAVKCHAAVLVGEHLWPGTGFPPLPHVLGQELSVQRFLVS